MIATRVTAWRCPSDRPGYGLSTRRPGRTHAQTVDDVVVIADALSWSRFAVAGASGGSGPALAVAALMTGRVSRCGVVVGAAPPVPEIIAAMSAEERAEWMQGAEGDEVAMADGLAEVLGWVEAGMPDVELPERSYEMLSETFREAGRQGPAGHIDDCIAMSRDWDFSVEHVRVPTRILGAQDDSDFMRTCSTWLAEHIAGAELIWRAGGHIDPQDNKEEELFAWLGEGH